MRRFSFIGLMVLLLGATLPAQLTLTDDPGRYLEYAQRYLDNRQYRLAEQEVLRGLGLSELSASEQIRFEDLLQRIREESRKSQVQKQKETDRKVQRIRSLRQREAGALAGLGRGVGGADPVLNQVNQAALASGRRAFTYRLVTLAELELEQGRYGNAMLLSALGVRYADEETAPLAQKVFMASVLDSFTIRQPLGSVPLQVTHNEKTISLIKGDSLLRYATDDGSFLNGFAPARKIIIDEPDLLVYVQDEGVMRWRPGWQSPRLLPGSSPLTVSAIPAKNDQLITADRSGKIQLWSRDDRMVNTLATSSGVPFQLTTRSGSTFARTSEGTVIHLFKEAENRVYTDPQGGYVYDLLPSVDGFAAPTSSGNILIGKSNQFSTTAIHTGTEVVTHLSRVDEPPIDFLSHSLDGTLIGWSTEGIEEYRITAKSRSRIYQYDAALKRIITWDTQGKLVTYNAATGEMISSITAPYEAFRQILTTGSQNTSVVKKANGTIALLSLITGQATNLWQGPTQYHLPVLLSKDKKTLLGFDAVGKALLFAPSPLFAEQLLQQPNYPDRFLTMDFINYFDLGESLQIFTSTR